MAVDSGGNHTADCRALLDPGGLLGGLWRGGAPPGRAKICGVSDRIGSIEPGKDADLAVFDGNPMEVFTDTLMTIIDGEIVYRKDGTKSRLQQ